MMGTIAKLEEQSLVSAEAKPGTSLVPGIPQSGERSKTDVDLNKSSDVFGADGMSEQKVKGHRLFF